MAGYRSALRAFNYTGSYRNIKFNVTITTSILHVAPHKLDSIDCTAVLPPCQQPEGGNTSDRGKRYVHILFIGLFSCF